MRCKHFSVLVLFLSLSLSASAATVQTVVDQVSRTSYEDFHRNSLYTHDGNNRGAWPYPSPDHDQASNNIYNAFQSFGLDATLDGFVYNAYPRGNVVATLPGTVHPERIYVVGAHYDSTSNPARRTTPAAWRASSRPPACSRNINLNAR